MDKKVKEQTNEIDLLELFLFLIKRWKWFVLAFIVGVGGALALYHYTVSPVYKASAEIYIANTNTVIEMADVQLSSALTVDYEEILLSRKVLKKVISDQDLDVNYTTLKSMISVTNPDDSHCLIISTTAESKDKAINITNSLVEYGIDQIYRIVGKDQPSVIDSAEADAVVQVQSSWTKYAVMGAMLGIVLLGALFVLQFLLDTTIKSEEDIEKYLSLNVLAIVPESSVATRKSKGGKHKK